MTKLHVSNLLPTMDDGDVRMLFQPFGDLVSVSVQRDETGASRGYGTCELCGAAMVEGGG